MKIKYSKIIPVKGFFAINLFGTVFVRKEYEASVKAFPERYETTWNHEAIHTEQIKECLYVFYYPLYLLFWIIRLLTPPFETAYRDISFEQEAFEHENELDYLKTRKPYNWLGYMFKSSRKKN